MTRLRLRTANVYAANHQRNAAARAVRAGDPDAIGGQEAWWLAALAGYRRTAAHRAAGRNGAEVPVFVDNRHTYHGDGAYCVTPDLGSRVAPDRWISWQRFDVDEHRFAAIGSHVNAALQRPDGALATGPRIKWAEVHMRALVDEVRRHRGDGFEPLVFLDANYARRPGQRKLWRWSPHRALARAGLTWYSHRVDGIAVPTSARVLNAGPFHIPGSDHDGFELVVDIPRRDARN